ncbi:hypothetical protein P609_15290 [Comamonas thiooxydans]|nr:hypothetical protein P609_15290 [Comamonas thiooxydans]
MFSMEVKKTKIFLSSILIQTLYFSLKTNSILLRVQRIMVSELKASHMSRIVNSFTSRYQFRTNYLLTPIILNL